MTSVFFPFHLFPPLLSLSLILSFYIVLFFSSPLALFRPLFYRLFSFCCFFPTRRTVGLLDF